MFKNNYQGGAVVEIFSGQGKDPVAKWKLYGQSTIRKEFNKEVKGFVYSLEGSSQTVKMQMPENGKMALGLRQRFLVLQVHVPECKDFSIELVTTDKLHLKRRLYISTVHKELSTTPLHARIPFVGLKRNIWCNLCIDVVSFIGGLFKGAAFLTLDGITLSASCQVRRIFTMKTEPAGISDDDMFQSGAALMELIPRSCHFPSDVYHVTQVLNVENLRKAEMKTGPISSDCVPDQSPTSRSASVGKTRIQGVSHTGRVSGSSQSGRKDGMDKSVPCVQNTGSLSSGRVKKKATPERPSVVDPSEESPHGETSHKLHKGTNGSLQPSPPKHPVSDKQSSKKLRVQSTGRERLASPASEDSVLDDHRNRSETTERSAYPSAAQESSQQPLTPTEKTELQTADELCCSPAKERSRASLTPKDLDSGWSRQEVSPDLQVWSSCESNEGSEPQLTLQEEVFTYASQPHSAKRGQGQGDREKMEMGDDQVQSKSATRYGAQPEDDFIGSEGDEDDIDTWILPQRTSVDSSAAIPRSPDQTLDAQLKVLAESHDLDQTPAKELIPATTNMNTECQSSVNTVPKRSISPTGSRLGPENPDGSNSVSLSLRFLQEVKLEDSRQHEEIEDKTLKHADASESDLHLLSSFQTHTDDEEELRMLASLKREEEDECSASGFSASQIHQCNVSISMSSDDTSTWTHVSMPENQGHHYQQEMNPLVCSDPREWMEVLSPPIMPPSPQRSRNKDPIRAEDEPTNENENEDEYLNLLYDPCLNCYFDPKSGKYYVLA
ncbi:protein CFAP20DC [Genypterus blacodes]|uniref:protein CFAP20DC n=1 Tax=Genypterus blacodes TaxID=154954 RepID=UPI003F768154